MITARPLTNKTKVTAICNGGLVGDLVVISGDPVGADLTVAVTDVSQNKPVIGVIIGVISPTRFVVLKSGDLDGVYTNLIPGKPYWAGINGRIVPNPPSIPGTKVYWQNVGVAIGSSVFQFYPSPELKIMR